MNPASPLVEVSDKLLYGALAVYALAFLACCLEWAFGSGSPVRRHLAAPPAEASSAAPVGGIRVVLRERGGGVVVREHGDARTAKAPGGGGPSGDSERADLLGRIGISLTVLAFLLNSATVLARGVATGRAPWGNMFEFSIAFGWAVAGAFVVLLATPRGRGHRWLAVPVNGTVLLTLGLAATVFYTDSGPLVPALQSYWLAIHVSAAVVCGGVFHVAAFAALLFLARERYERRTAQGAAPTRLAGIWRRLPSARSLDNASYRLNALVFPLWTFAIIAGAIWAEAAWGRFWGWDPKETWAFITWAAYAAYFHARSTAGWKGRKAATVSLLAFACFVFNYYGVNLLINGLHSYSGV
nr:c-type cytochrome biogenesis protein CcsB [Kitasatospora purpeofusca]